MTEEKTWDWGKILFRLAALMYAIALVAYFFHALDINPQFDTQGIRYSLELLSAKDQGQLWDWLTQIPPRKYPLLYILPFSLLESFFWVSNEGMDMIHVHAITRLVTVLYALGTFWVLGRITRRLFGDHRAATLLLMTSTNFFLFSTAVRPHMAAAFWMLMTFSLSFDLRHDSSLKMKCLAFGSAACSFAVLQSGLFAFFFPVFAILFYDRHVQPFLKAAGWSIGAGALGLIVGYPFVLTMLSGATGATTLAAGMNHDVGIFMLPELLPLKFWQLFACDSILLLAAAYGVWKTWQKKEKTMPILITLFLFVLVFGMQPITSPRFFIPVLPFFAILGAPALIGRRRLHMAIACLCILMFAKLALLAAQPNTYQRASAFVNAQDGFLLTRIPTYFLNVPDEKYAKTDQDAKRLFFLLKENEHIPDVEALPLCASFIATDLPTENLISNYMFLWQEVEWPLLYLAGTKSLGINLRMYCTPPL